MFKNVKEELTSGVYYLKWGSYIYIGSSKNIARRIKEHFKLLRNNKHTNKKMQQLFDKHGEPIITKEYCAGYLAREQQQLTMLFKTTRREFIINEAYDVRYYPK